MALSPAAIHARLLTAGLPTFDRTVARLEHLVVQVEAPAAIIASVVATDPSLATLIIGQTNAAGHATTRLSDAIRRCGMGVVLSTARSAVPVPEEQRSALASCWAQANAAAVLMPILIDYRKHLILGRWDDETLYLVGLIHDLGHTMAMTQFRSEYDRAVERLSAGESDLESLIASEVGVSTSQLITLGSRLWSLPPVLSIPMAHWRHPSSAPDLLELTAAVHVTHVLVHAAGYTAAGDRYVPSMDDWAMDKLNLRIADCEILLARMFDAMDELELHEGALRT
jgi:HD-like signal output (HDOD) protein